MADTDICGTVWFDGLVHQHCLLADDGHTVHANTDGTIPTPDELAVIAARLERRKAEARAVVELAQRRGDRRAAMTN